MTKTTPAPTTARHRTDLVSLFFGLLFLTVAAWWAGAHFLDITWWNLDWDLPNLGWFVAGGLILLGLIGILATLRRDRSEPAGQTTDPADPGTDRPE